MVHLTDKEATIHLLEYYAGLSVHHRLMMVGFATIYFGINQFMLVTPADIVSENAGKLPLGYVLSAGLLTTFVLACVLHHACHFCSNAGMKALMSAELHYRHLPPSVENSNHFEKWMANTSNKMRVASSVPKASIVIVGLLFMALVAINSAIYIALSKRILEKSHLDNHAIFFVFVAWQILIAAFYGVTFLKHFQALLVARRELTLVMDCDGRDEVDKKIQKLGYFAPASSTYAGQLLDSHVGSNSSSEK